MRPVHVWTSWPDRVASFILVLHWVVAYLCVSSCLAVLLLVRALSFRSMVMTPSGKARRSTPSTTALMFSNPSYSATVTDPMGERSSLPRSVSLTSSVSESTSLVSSPDKPKFTSINEAIEEGHYERIQHRAEMSNRNLPSTPGLAETPATNEYMVS